MHELTSEKIYRYIKRHKQTTAAELSRALILTKADIRYHLSRMIKLGIIRREEKQSRKGAGRPGYFYMVAREEQTSCYPSLTQICLDILTAGKDVIHLEELSQNLAKGISLNFPDFHVTGAGRLTASIQFLNDLGYEASWEARPDTPIVMLRRCPYHDIAAANPILCRMDTCLIEAITGWNARITQRLLDRTSPSPYCLFSLNQSPYM